MGRAEERRARQRGGHRAAPRRRASRGTAGGGGGADGKKGFIRRLFTWKVMLGSFLGACLLGIGGFIVLYMMVQIPEGNALAVQQSNTIKYSNGDVLIRDGKVNRETVELAKVPKKVQLTFVAAENKTFYQDAGIDLKGTARGVLNTLSGKGKQGGSTITQQYVKNYYLTQDQTVTRKLRELVISLKVDRQMSKDDILAGYINTSYYGRGAYGIQAAAQAYYRVDAEDLDVAQGAYLAALLQAPSQYDWAVASDTGKRLVKQRWNYVLDNMVGEGWLKASERQGLKFPVPEEPKAEAGLKGQKGYFVKLAKQQLVKQLMEDDDLTQDEAEAQYDKGGWTITLTIDRKKQAALEKAVKTQLLDNLDTKKREVDRNIQAGAASVDPRTGHIVALYGGEDYIKHYYNNANRVDYQPASTFKPVILAAALEHDAETQDGERIGARTVYDGTSKRPVEGSDIAFSPENEDDVDYGDVTVQTAMNKSINSVFAQMGVDVGMDKVLRTADDLGMDTKDLKALPAYTLGTMGASPIQMAGVYATFDHHGKKVSPTIIKKAERNGSEVKMADPIGEQVISRETADTVTSVLTGVVDDGTARASVRDNPARSGQHVAGKTGTSDDNKSAWFTGYTPDLVTSVGLFGEDHKTKAQTKMYGAGGVERVNGGGFPAGIWAAYTFGVTSGDAEFELETEQGAAVERDKEPSQSPSSEAPETEEPSKEPTTQAPSRPASQAPTTPPPTQPPAQQEPTTQAPTTQAPTTRPPVGGGGDDDEDPANPDNAF